MMPTALFFSTLIYFGILFSSERTHSSQEAMLLCHSETKAWYRKTGFLNQSFYFQTESFVAGQRTSPVATIPARRWRGE